MGERGPVPAMLGAVGEPVYRAVIRARNRRFDRGRRVTRLPVPVVSVGNISVGGTGKTPFVMMIVEMLREAGIVPVVAMRGYRADPAGESDEAAEYRDRFADDVPIVVGADRVSGLRALLRSRNDVGCIVLDDGFQHRFVARDLDIVLLDATRNVFADHCLPRGWLREPVQSLARANVVVLTRTDAVERNALEKLEHAVRAGTDALLVRAAHEWEGFDVDDRSETAQWARGKRVVAVCAIGNAQAFLTQLERAGASVAGQIIERDHHHWNPSDLRRIQCLVNAAPQGVDAVVTTGKDWVKLRKLGDWGAEASGAGVGAPIARARVRMAILTGGQELRRLVLGAANRRGTQGAGAS